jgi:glycosyltransferase involved in cell wall biosynthesis
MSFKDKSTESYIIAASFKAASIEAPNGWVGHLPLASWIIQQVRPKIFVELGTHTGNSYFSFCQTVEKHDLPTSCYAIDTWAGDEHAGHYSDEVFYRVDHQNRENYEHFSQLMRMTFDDALFYFADASIDLFHIDGLHTYEAVKHDFESWLPKLAPGAVVLFHDTQVREANFGVWKLWQELKEQYPLNIEFLHSHGLGVLQLNNAEEHQKVDCLEWSSEAQQSLVRYFADLGDRHMLIFENKEIGHAVAERDGQLAALNQAVAERDRQLAMLKKAIQEQDGRISLLEHNIFQLSENAQNLTLIVQSAKRWQKRSWAKRAFHRWRAPGEDRYRINFLKRLELSLRRRRDHLLKRSSNIQRKKNDSESKKSGMKFIQALAFHYSGKPRGWVRFLIFHKNRKPRKIFKRIACKKSGSPRPAFSDWINNDGAIEYEKFYSAGYQMQEIAARFNAEEYLKLNTDVHSSGVNPLTHYIKYGTIDCKLFEKENIDLESITTSISVVIPTHNRAGSLENTIQAIFDRAEGLNIEVVVVNDGSSDHTEEVLNRIQSKQPSLRYITIPNQGAGVARNHGAAAAKNDIILFMGDDILPASRNFLAAHARYHQSHCRNNLAVLGKVDWPPGDIFEITPVMHHIQGSGGEQFGYTDMQTFMPWDWRFFYTCNVSVRRHVVEDWLKEGFSPAFTGCCFEDGEFAYRMNKKYGNFPILYIDESVGHHYHRHTVSTFLRRQHFAGAMAKVLVDLHPDTLAPAGFSAVQQALMTNSPQDLPSICANLALAESLFSWAQSLEERGVLGTENWHKQLLHCIFRISALLGYIDNAGTAASNHASALKYILDSSFSPLIDALPNEYWHEKGYIYKK